MSRSWLAVPEKEEPVPKMIFVNLPVADLEASMTFYKSTRGAREA